MGVNLGLHSSQDQLVCICKRLLWSILHLVMGHLSIDLSPHMYAFPINTALSDSLYLPVCKVI